MKTIARAAATAMLSFLIAAQADAAPVVISSRDAVPGAVNEWIAFRRDVRLEEKPSAAVARIAADSKYWLWINGQLAVFEGGLKRGPNRTDSYFDEVDLAQWLRKGTNSIAVLTCHFGKSGFSHVDSGASQFYFDCPAINLESDTEWRCAVHPAYGICDDPQTNRRLPESNIRYDARKSLGNWQTDHALPSVFREAVAVENRLGALHKRPIPMWKDYGQKLLDYTFHRGADRDTIIAVLPYNMQFTPAIDVYDFWGGSTIQLYTDHVRGGSDDCVRAEYITDIGQSRYESFGWMNGERLYVVFPHGVNVEDVYCRETGYDMTPEGRFSCDDDFWQKFWTKALRTLYVNARDNYFDCPDRERAQWWGDLTLLMAESFYSYSTSSHALAKKGILQLCAWQKEDGTLFSPIPGNYKKELPSQMLASIGRYGFWTYYMHTGDWKTIQEAYPAVKKYLALWTLDSRGLPEQRQGGWNWGDWGDNKDIGLIQAAWLYMAYEAAAKMAPICNCATDVPAYKAKMEKIKDGINKYCWTGEAYRHPSYDKKTDDRAQALAVVSGIAGADKYEAIYKFLRDNEHASPYMEKYVMEALFVMGHGGYAMERARKRFGPMVESGLYSTLWEGWGVGRECGFGGGTTNHAWSGGAMIVIAAKLAGIEPTVAGWREFSVKPVSGIFGRYEISFPTVSGTVALSCKESATSAVWNLTVPKGTVAHVTLPGDSGERILNGGRHVLRVSK